MDRTDLKMGFRSPKGEIKFQKCIEQAQKWVLGIHRNRKKTRFSGSGSGLKPKPEPETGKPEKIRFEPEKNPVLRFIKYVLMQFFISISIFSILNSSFIQKYLVRRIGL